MTFSELMKRPESTPYDSSMFSARAALMPALRSATDHCREE